MIQRFVIEGNPRGQGRPRACKRGKHAAVYEAKEDTVYKENLAAQVVAQRPSFIERDVPITLYVEFYLPRPQSHYGAKGLKERFENARPTGKPDCSNMLKAIEDALNGIVWHDDSQIVEEIVSKHYADTKPHTVLTVRRP